MKRHFLARFYLLSLFCAIGVAAILGVAWCQAFFVILAIFAFALSLVWAFINLFED